MLAGTVNDGLPAGPARSIRPEGRRFHLVDRDHPERTRLQAFIAAEFARAYGARLDHFCDVLVGRTGPDGDWTAALGFTHAQTRPLFLEQYLDVPVQQAIARHAQVAVRRADIVEVGNLAARSPGASRAMIVFMTAYLSSLGLKWVAFTATRALLNAFSRLHLDPVVLADADPARLPGQGENWGSYYACGPKVLYGDIDGGYDCLAR